MSQTIHINSHGFGIDKFCVASGNLVTEKIEIKLLAIKFNGWHAVRASWKKRLTTKSSDFSRFCVGRQVTPFRCRPPMLSKWPASCRRLDASKSVAGECASRAPARNPSNCFRWHRGTRQRLNASLTRGWSGPARSRSAILTTAAHIPRIRGVSGGRGGQLHQQWPL